MSSTCNIEQAQIINNYINTYQWYRERDFHLEKPLTDRYETLRTEDI